MPAETQIVQITDEKVKIDIIGAFKCGWEVFKEQWQTLILFGVVLVALNFVENLVTGRVRGIFVSLFVSLGFMVLSLLVSVGLIQATIEMVRGKKVSVEMLFNQVDKIWRYFLLTLFLGVMVGFGLLLFVVPGIYLALRFAFAPYLIVDKDLGVTEAIKLSSQMTAGIKWQLLLVGLVALGLNFLGMLAFGIGLVVTSPVTYLAFAYLYDQLLPRAKA